MNIAGGKVSLSSTASLAKTSHTSFFSMPNVVITSRLTSGLEVSYATGHNVDSTSAIDIQRAIPLTGYSLPFLTTVARAPLNYHQTQLHP